MEIGTKGKNKRNNVKTGTWNIKTLNEKELELVEEFKKANTAFIVVTETKKKEVGKKELRQKFIEWEGLSALSVLILYGPNENETRKR